MSNAIPFEILAAPFTAYIGPVGTAFPDIKSAPAGGWILLGVSGSKSQSEAGVKVKHDQTIDKVMVGGTTGPVKALRKAEELVIALELYDLTLEAYAAALNQATITTVAAATGIAGEKSIKMHQGIVVAEHALLLRGDSPYGAAFNMQYEVPRVYMSGKPSPVLEKGKPAGLAFEFTALEDLTAGSDDARFGVLRAQTAAALP